MPFVVRRVDSEEIRVVKVYEKEPPKGYQQVLERLSSRSDAQRRHLVEIFEFGVTSDGLWWEEQEYCRATPISSRKWSERFPPLSITCIH